MDRPISVWLTPALILALTVLVILFDPAGLESSLGNGLFDAYQRHLPRIAQGPVRAVPLDLPALDEDSLIKATRALAASGAALLVFTVPPDPAPSPQTLIPKLPPGSDEARAALAKLPEPGHDLAVELRALPGVVPVILGGANGRWPHIRTKFIYRGSRDPFGKVPRFDTAAAVPGVLEANAASVGAPGVMTGADGVVRSLPLALHLGNMLVPGLAAEAARVAQARPDITVTTDERDPLTFLRGVGIAALEGGARGAPTDSNGAIRLRFAPPQERLDIGAPGDLKGMIVVAGPAGRSIITPLGMDSPAGVTAQAIQNLLDGTALSRPAWTRPAEALAVALAGLVMTLLLLHFGPGWAAALVILLLPAMFYGSWFGFAQASLLLDATTPALGLALAFLGGTLAWLRDLRMARMGLQMAFSDSLPRATIEKIARRPSLLTVEGETRTVTYLVCGVRGLAGLAAEHRDDAAGFTSLMQRVLTPLIDQALAHGGTVDRLTADGFAAFWNAPLDDPEHALHACEAANGMSIMSSRVTEHIASETRRNGQPMPQVEIGVGIATGSVIAGGFGGYGRMGYSVNGDTVVLAQRIQALSHQYGPAVIAAEITKRGAERGFAWLEVDTIAAGPSDPPVTLFAMAGNPVFRASPKFRALAVFHDHIFQAIRKQQWGVARELIAQCRRLSGASQKMYDLHLSRIAYFETHPPGPDWDGAFRPILE